MPVIPGRDAEVSFVIEVAKLMCIAARTAPKARGIDNIETAIVYGDDLNRLADEMERVGKECGWEFCIRDAESVRRSHAVVLIGLKDTAPIGLNCESCGLNCTYIVKAARERKAFRAPLCAMQLLNLGIAIGSAVKIAADLNVDNRVMFSVGVAARRLKIVSSDIVIGIPLSAYGKNIYFDRRRKT